MYYLKAAKVTRQLPQTSFIPEKDPGKETILERKRSSSRKWKKPGKPLCWEMFSEKMQSLR